MKGTLILLTESGFLDIKSRLKKGSPPPRETYPYIVERMEVEEESYELFELLSLKVSALNVERGSTGIYSYIIVGASKREDPYEAYEIVDEAYEIAYERLGKFEVSTDVSGVRFIHISGARGDRVRLTRLSRAKYKAYVPEGYSLIVYKPRENSLSVEGPYPDPSYDRSELQSALYEDLKADPNLECVKIILLGKTTET